MKYEFGVACQYHCAGAGIDCIGELRFPDYASAKDYADKEDECIPTIYIIINDRYVFYCGEYLVTPRPGDAVPWIYSIESKPWGQIETRIWWGKFIENPEAFFHLAEGEIGA